MADLRINKGDSATISEVISGLDSLSGYSAKLYIYESDGTQYDTVTGSISDLTITYEFVNDTTKDYTVGRYSFETKLWSGSDQVFTPSKGIFHVRSVLVTDPS